MKSVLLALGLVLSFGTLASAADSGVFCNPQNEIVQWVCGERPYGRDWVAQPNNCWHRNTHESCYDEGGRDLRHRLFQVEGHYQTFYGLSSTRYCAFQSEYDVEEFRRRSYGYGRTEYVNRLPRDMRYDGFCRL